jgi:hypothetical protein
MLEDKDLVCIQCGYSMPAKLQAQANKAKPAQSHTVKKPEADSAPIKPKLTDLDAVEPGITRAEFFAALEKASQPIKLKKDDARSSQLTYALALLRDDAINAFTRDVNNRVSQHKQPAEDAWWETFVDRNDLENLSKMLKHWHKYLSALPYSQYQVGALDVLNTLSDLCNKIDKTKPRS